MADLNADKIALEIVCRGAQILLPYDAGDAAVSWSSRRNLAAHISAAIRAAYAHGIEDAAVLTEECFDKSAAAAIRRLK